MPYFLLNKVYLSFNSIWINKLSDWTYQPVHLLWVLQDFIPHEDKMLSLPSANLFSWEHIIWIIVYYPSMSRYSIEYGSHLFITYSEKIPENQPLSYTQGPYSLWWPCKFLLANFELSSALNSRFPQVRYHHLFNCDKKQIQTI